MNNDSKIIYKSFVGGIEKNSFASDARTINSYITTKSPDRHNEIVDSNGITLDNYRKNPVVLLNHQSNGLPIGKNLWIKTDSNGLIAQTQFAKTSLAEDVMNLYADGFMNAFSIGFIPMNKTKDLDERTVYTQSELYEYSCVTIPANAEAVTMMLKSVRSPELISQFEQYNKNLELENKINELFESKKTFEDSLNNISDLSVKIKKYEDVETKINQLQETINQQAELISKLNFSLTNIMKKEKAVNNQKTVEKLIAQSINKRLGLE